MTFFVKPILEKLRQSGAGYPEEVLVSNGKIYTFVNPYSYKFVRRNHDLFNSMDGIFADGIFMCFNLRLFFGLKVPRLSFDMTKMAKDLFEKISTTGESIYIIGAKQNEVEDTVGIIRENYPDINICGYRNGYFSDDAERDEILGEIIDLNPDYLIAGLGTPLQEKFILELKKRGFRGTAFTCGAFVKQTSGGLNYYPGWVDKYNLRYFYRQFNEKGLFSRNFDTFIRFPYLMALDRVKFFFEK